MQATRRQVIAAAFAALTARAQTESFESDAERERFLQEAELVRRTALSEGITNSQRLTLSFEGFEHDAQFQTVNESRPSGTTLDGVEMRSRDSYQFNLAAYRLSRLLGLGTVPVATERVVDDSRGAVSWWVDDLLMSEKARYLNGVQPPDHEHWNRRIHVVRVFDELIYNSDRNLGNLLITKDWTIWMIDHTRAFRPHKTLRNEKRLERCDRRLLEAVRGLDRETATEQLAQWCEEIEIEALFARRNAITAHFDARIAQLGESEVLFDL